jgi:cell division protein FtsB
MASTRGPGRGATRPAARTRHTRPAASTRPATGTPVRPTAGAPRRQAPPHVWRLVTLVLLVGFLALFLTPTLRGYLDQRAEISRMEQLVAEEEQRIVELEEQIAAWDDPAYVERQARERLRFVKPGETAFTVLDDTGEQLTEPLPGMAPVTTEVHTNRPWYGEVWESIRTANEGLPEEPGAEQQP